MSALWKALGLALSLTLLFDTASCGATARASSPLASEQEVRRLDALEADAVLRGDYALIDELWAADFIVNNPTNSVGYGRSGPVMKGTITYSSFERVIEFVSIRGDIAIAMGHEVVVPKAPSLNAGRTLHRRYTNIWTKWERGWKLSVRHANVYLIEPA